MRGKRDGEGIVCLEKWVILRVKCWRILRRESMERFFGSEKKGGGRSLLCRLLYASGRRIMLQRLKACSDHIL